MGKKLYKHCITIGNAFDHFIRLEILNYSATPIQSDVPLLLWFDANDFKFSLTTESAKNIPSNYYGAKGRWVTSGSTIGNVQCVAINSDNDNMLVITNSVTAYITLSNETITDIVLEIK